MVIISNVTKSIIIASIVQTRSKSNKWATLAHNNLISVQCLYGDALVFYTKYTFDDFHLATLSSCHAVPRGHSVD